MRFVLFMFYSETVLNKCSWNVYGGKGKWIQGLYIFFIEIEKHFDHVGWQENQQLGISKW